MAIVLVIIGLLLGGLLMPLSAQVDQRRISETQKALDEINQALIGFAVANDRLPCPADPTIVSGTPGAGQENRPGGVCASAVGALPWAALGVNETDAWGRRYTYRVTTTFADATDGTGCGTPRVGVSFELCSPGDITILAATVGATLASSIPAVIVSHGPNGLGAYNTAGVLIGGAAGEELTNTGGTTTFISHTPTATFDDLVTWVSPNILFNRMVTAGRLP